MKRCTMPLFALFVAMAASSLFGCSNQAEGDRCSRLAGNSGNDDCEPGLSCQLIGALELCCPYGRAPTVPECVPGSNLADAGGDTAQEAQSPEASGDETGQTTD